MASGKYNLLKWQGHYRSFGQVLSLSLGLIWMMSAPAQADYVQAKAAFEQLPDAERINLNIDLAAAGDYVGIFRKVFSKRLYRAILAFQKNHNLAEDGILSPDEMTLLRKESGEFIGALGLQKYRHPQAPVELFLPEKLFDRKETTPHGLSFERDDKNLSLSYVYYPAAEKNFAALYDTLSSDVPAKGRAVSYRRIKPEFFVVSGQARKRNFYSWFWNLSGEGAAGFTLSWSPAWDNIGMRSAILMANSFFVLASDGSKQQTPAAADEDEPDENTATDQPNPTPGQAAQAAPAAPEQEAPTSGTGTGFKISQQDHVLTNSHVAGNCQSITLNRAGEPTIAASLVAKDTTNDLAILKASQPLAGPAAYFADTPTRIGEDIAVFGFPLSDILADTGNFVTGNVTALAGLGNDTRMLQISAPLQPGNSGGPVVGRDGAVLGVVVSKLNAVNAIQYTGDVPQNVNFAIKSTVARSFIESYGVTFSTQGKGTMLESTALAEISKAFTYKVDCRN